jgi:Lysozyme like domain
MAVKGLYAAEVLAGFVLAWSGIKGDTLQTTLTDLLKGVNPAKVTEATPTIGLASDSTTASSSTGSGTLPPALANASGDYSNAQLQSIWKLAGGASGKAAVAACIAQHESSGNAKVTSSNPDGGINVGLWQLDTKGKGAGYTVAQLQNPLTNAKVAIKGSSNGTDWSAWSTASACGV